MGHLKKNQRNLGPKAQMCTFFTYQCFLEGFCLQVMIRKSGKLWRLRGNGFLKASSLYFKTLQSFACPTLPEKEKKGLFLKFWWECLKLWFFCPKISKKWYFWHESRLQESHKFGLNSWSESPYLIENVDFFFVILELGHPPFLK